MSDDLVKRLIANGLDECDEAAARIRELEAELAALREARGVMVKPLVWEDWSARHRTNYTAETPFGRYGVMQFHFPDMHFKIEPPSGKPVIAASLDAAKAAAQADYERRILAALEPAPVTPAEAARVLLGGIPNPIFDQLKPVMIGEFHLDFVGADEDGNEINYARAVPWTEIKAIIRTALRALADAGEAG